MRCSMAWKEIKSGGKMSVAEQSGAVGILIEYERGGSAFTQYTTREDAQNALALARSAIRDGHSYLWVNRRVLKSD